MQCFLVLESPTILHPSTTSQPLLRSARQLVVGRWYIDLGLYVDGHLKILCRLLSSSRCDRVCCLGHKLTNHETAARQVDPVYATPDIDDDHQCVRVAH